MSKSGGTVTPGSLQPYTWDEFDVTNVARERRSQAELLVAYVVIGARSTVIGAYAQVIWTPPRPRAEFVPTNINVAEVRLTDPGRVLVDKRVDGAAARELARAVNALSRETGGEHSCPNDSGRRWEIRFPTPHIVVDDLSCGAVAFTVRGRSEPVLAEDEDIGMKVAQVLHVSTNEL